MSERRPRCGEDVHVIGASPEWHQHYYDRGQRQGERGHYDPWAWTYRRANGTIVDIDWEQGEIIEVLVEMDAGGTLTFGDEDFTRYTHPGGAAERGMWIVT